MEKQRTEEIAANRLKLISPLLDPALDRDKRQMLKEQLCIQSGLSERTVRRYLNLYQEKGFEGSNPGAAAAAGIALFRQMLWKKPLPCAGKCQSAV